VGVLTNLLTLLAVSWIFYGIMLACILTLFWQQGAALLAWLVSWLIRYVLTVSKFCSSIPLAAVYTKSVFIVIWVICVYLMVFLFLLRKRRTPYLLVAAVVGSLAIALLLSWVMPLIDRSRVTVLDVGQGQSIILQSGGKTFLVDCGGDDPEEAADQAAETLLAMGIYRLDGLVLTHYDADHADGIPYLLGRVPADMVFLPDPAEDPERKERLLSVAGETAVLVLENQKLTWDTSSMTIFAPFSYVDDNESGLSVLFRGENCDILITGDMRTTAEKKLLLDEDVPQLTALVAGHHGSEYSTGGGLLAVTKPQYVFISVGKDNPYGHPGQAVLERLEQYGCIVYRTDLDGTIVFRR
jgi:competence protein ComEC